MDSIEDLISSRKTLSTRRKEFFGSYNTPQLMGVEGCNIDGFLARLGRDVAACKLETFNWADYQILLCINMLTNGKDEMRLAERLMKVYNSHSIANTRMMLANVGTEVKQFREISRRPETSCTMGPRRVETIMHLGRAKEIKAEDKRKEIKRKPPAPR